MNSLDWYSPGAFPASRATVHEARAAVMAVDRALRDKGLAGPADAYHVMGSLGLMMRTEERALSELVAWLREEERRRRLTVTEGPFVDDPEAAVGVAVQALVQASRASRDAFDALERAHIATAHLATAPTCAQEGSTKKPRRRSLWRRPGA